VAGRRETSLTRQRVAAKAWSVTFERLSWPARTDRLTFRPARVADLPDVFAYRCLEEVGQWMPGRPTSYDEWLLLMDKEAMGRTMVLELDGRVIGDLYLHVENGWAQYEVRDGGENTQAEIGWCLSPDHQGQGYITEAVTELVRLCFEDLGIRRLAAVAFAENTPSLRIMEKLGMRREALFRKESLHRDLGWVDSVTYALLVDDWREGLKA
jgi:RimJ/RimL family protein N-acetyltransferase